ncbi:MAG: DUF1501 domain-containing protein [Planctomycetaceae bacterium]|nr:DUF1501 domain-containing protein [Planctomycetaceae bacterium]MBT6154194.1 DUF1501 domain-containing protein [Planctomycetaceae bacterium]MBT6487818.1 DUF1501 domain-containing protein [Planctomycetaceae bacterium]MBT6494457.1 DUF1501 domain-containing protein [Planctomycetaceae bacterium]
MRGQNSWFGQLPASCSKTWRRVVEQGSTIAKTGLNRKEFLQVGFSGFLGLGLNQVLGRKSFGEGDRGRRPVRSVVLVFLTGAPSHQDMWDLKPEGPTDTRGEFRPIETNVPGVLIGPHLPKLAKLADKYAIIRSMRHSLPSHEHGTHRLLTGINKEPPGSTHMVSRNDWPCYASGVQYLRPNADGSPSGVMLPTYLNNGYGFCGQHAGFLGADYDPWHMIKDPNAKNFRVDELELSPGLTVERLKDRRALMLSIDSQRRALETAPAVRDLSQRMQQAHNILLGGKFRAAFDIDQETVQMRDRYGRHQFGQSMLLARRLVEARTPVVQVNVGRMNNWDTHVANFKALKTRLLPSFDGGLASFVSDLDERGLLDETLIIATGEFGRTPKVNAKAGRDHWSRVFSTVFIGGGINGGQVIGSSDSMASDPISRAYYPADLGATVYSAMGIDPQSQIIDRIKRPHELNAGEVIGPLYS